MTRNEPTQAHALTARDRTLVATLVLGVALPLLDTTLVNVSLETIRLEFRAPISAAQWVVTGYTLAAASAVPASAWLASKLGQKKVWLICLWAFLLGSALAAMAPNLTMLIAARVLQGLATGILLPTMQTITIIEVGRAKSRAALAAVSIPSVIAPILGPPIGGFTLQLLNWHWVFWLHIPICVGAIVAASRRLSDAPRMAAHRVDPTALLALSLGLTLTIFGASQIHEHSAWWPLSLLAGIALLALFIARAIRPHSNSPIDLRIFGDVNFSRWCTILFLSSAAFYGGALLLPLTLMYNHGYTPGQAGLMLALHGVGTLIARQNMTTACARWGDRRTTLGACTLAAAGSILLFPTSIFDTYSVIAAGMIMRGAGVGVITIMSMSGAYQKLAIDQIPHASLASRVMTNVGAALGAALVAATAATSLQGSGLSGGLQNSHYALGITIGLCGAVVYWSPRNSA